MDVGNLTFSSSAFSKSSFHIWKFLVHILLKPSLKDFKHYLASVWNECNCVVVWEFFGIAFLWDWNENLPSESCDHCWVFQICWHIECSTFIASSFRIWNISTGIPSSTLALFVVMLLRSTWLHILGCLALITPLWLSGLWRSLLYSSSVCSCHLFLISSASVRSIPFLSFIVPMFAWNFPCYL